MRKTLSSLVMLILLALLPTACRQQGMPLPEDPVQAVSTIVDKQQAVKTQQVEINTDVAIKLQGINADSLQAQQILPALRNFKGNVKLTGAVDNTEGNAQLQGELNLGVMTPLIANGEDVLKFDLRKVGSKVYLKSAVNEDWIVQDLSTDKAAPQPNVLPFEQITQLLKQSGKAEKLGDETIDGVDAYHYRVTLDPVALFKAVSGMAESAGSATLDAQQLDQIQTLLKQATVEAEIWAGKDDLLLRQMKIHFLLDAKEIPNQPGASALIDLTATDKASQLNEPVNITAPQ
jgi:hypothetical protein